MYDQVTIKNLIPRGWDEAIGLDIYNQRRFDEMSDTHSRLLGDVMGYDWKKNAELVNELQFQAMEAESGMQC